MYSPRVIDNLFDSKLKTFGGILVTGPKGCGKTTTAKHHARSFIELQDEDQREAYLSVAEVKPSNLLIGEKPRLIDEWQDAPKIWGAVRKSIDDEQKVGQYILTGSTSKKVDVPHTGTLRISRLKMYPLSLFESGESNGTVSIRQLFEDPEHFEGCHSDLSVDDLIYAICRGGWPGTFIISDKKNRLDVARDLFRQTCEVDISNIDGVRRSPVVTAAILRSYARNICTITDNKTIIGDVNFTIPLSDNQFYEYIDALTRLHIVDNVDAWCPAIRSRTAIRSTPKKNLVDPSIATAALGISQRYFDTDFKTLGFLFESLCIRDLKVYSSPDNGRVSYYHDRYGLEADAVLHLEDGRYALCEIKLGENEVESAAKHLNKIESLINEKNKTEKQMPIRPPDVKVIITATEYGYRRKDGVLVIPIGCLRD